MDFWKGKNIKLIDSIAAETEKNVKERTQLEENLREIVGDEDLQMVMRCISTGKSKQVINNLLVKQYGSKKAGELYKKIKPLLKEKKGK